MQTLRLKGGLDAEKVADLSEGKTAAESILNRANEAVGKEQRLAAVADLQSRVEDWKGHRIDHFGDLLLYGNFTVVKGEGAKPVEREVRAIFDALNPECRRIVRVATLQPPKSPVDSPESTELKRFRSGFGDLAEEHPAPMSPVSAIWRTQSASKKLTAVMGTRPSEPTTPTSLSRKNSYDGWDEELVSYPPSPSRTSSMRSPSALAALREKLVSSISGVRRAYSPKSLHDSAHDNLINTGPFPMNGPFQNTNTFFHEEAFQWEERFADAMGLVCPGLEQYKIYLFERILLCCKEVGSNKSKKMGVGPSKTNADSKGRPRLQLKGRIFMQNVTDVLSFVKTGMTF